MDSTTVLTGLLLVAAITLIVKVQTAPPGSPWSWDAIRNSWRALLGLPEPWRPRPAEYFTDNIPKTWPIRSILTRASEELQAMRTALVSAQAVHLPEHIIHSYDANMKQAGRLLNRNGDRIVQAARTGPVSPQLEEALNRKQQSLQRLLEALQLARGSLAAVIVTGLEDQRDLDRVTISLQAWSEAISDVSADTAGVRLSSSVHET
jgi:hypothetical protein